ncbi:plastocyanin/azurin family copper-binding protein [Alkalilacustris brevis]|uniref:plastocyanin/azurin family copper-binding protein n=1 Tax=Alkalilacustris brevis TaxID=2026338 RepID=UPI000E0DF527|nr:plastocyanin/azurin family copper-binding protein [Alkalilacustris brevis]
MKLPITSVASERREAAFSRREGLMLFGLGAAGLVVRPGRLMAAGETHTVTAHNRAPDGAQMAFAPAVLHIAPGDTVDFRHADRGHNVQSFDEMQPDGGVSFGGTIGEEISVTFDVEGTYGYFCQPHLAMGMIGYVLVGDFTINLDQVRTTSNALRGPMAARRVEEYFEQIALIGSGV